MWVGACWLMYRWPDYYRVSVFDIWDVVLDHPLALAALRSEFSEADLVESKANAYSRPVNSRIETPRPAGNSRRVILECARRVTRIRFLRRTSRVSGNAARRSETRAANCFSHRYSF